MKPKSHFFQFSCLKKSESPVISGKKLAVKKRWISCPSDARRGLWCGSERPGLRRWRARVALSSLPLMWNMGEIIVPTSKGGREDDRGLCKALRREPGVWPALLQPQLSWCHLRSLRGPVAWKKGRGQVDLMCLSSWSLSTSRVMTAHSTLLQTKSGWFHEKVGKCLHKYVKPTSVFPLYLK